MRSEAKMLPGTEGAGSVVLHLAAARKGSCPMLLLTATLWTGGSDHRVSGLNFPLSFSPRLTLAHLLPFLVLPSTRTSP